MKKLFYLILAIFSGRIMQKYKPTVIAVTGSLGKTGTKEAIYHVLQEQFSVRKSVKSYNNEVGVPLTIIGEEPETRAGWLAVFAKAVRLLAIRDRSYPNLLILEMGVQKPKDMDYLLDMARPNIGVLTSIAPVHFEFFRRFESLVKEKHKLPLSVPENGIALLNADDEEVMKVGEKLKCKAVTFGFAESADVRSADVRTIYSDDRKRVVGLNFKLIHNGTAIPVFVPGILGAHKVYAFLAAFAVGFAYKMHAVEIAERLALFSAPPGRMKLVDGIKESIIIDDTYNAALQSTLKALSAIQSIEIGSRKIAVLGDMMELGSLEHESHEAVGKAAAEIVDILITAGAKARMIASAALRTKSTKKILSENVFSFDEPVSAGKFLKEHIKEGDVVLAKGSQLARMEKCVKMIMRDPSKARDLLVRQERAWN